VTDFLQQKRAEIMKRLNELRPLVDEFHQLEAASSALRGVTGSRNATGTATPRRRPGRPRGSRTTTRAAGTTAARTRTTRRRTARTASRTTAARSTAARGTAARSTAARSTRRTTARSTGRRPGRRRGSGARAAQTLQLVNGQPGGITIPELAAKMGIKQNYLYRVLPALQKEGKVRKRGRTWLPKAA
jgi:hypothetical protein